MPATTLERQSAHCAADHLPALQRSETRKRPGSATGIGATTPQLRTAFRGETATRILCCSSRRCCTGCLPDRGGLGATSEGEIREIDAAVREGGEGRARSVLLLHDSWVIVAQGEFHRVGLWADRWFNCRQILSAGTGRRGRPLHARDAPDATLMMDLACISGRRTIG